MIQIEDTIVSFDIFVKKFIFDSPFFDYWLSCIKTKML